MSEACDENATRRPSVLTDGEALRPSASPPPASTLTRVVTDCAPTTGGVSRPPTRTSRMVSRRIAPSSDRSRDRQGDTADVGTRSATSASVSG
jgi:hypothetical protein